MGYFLFFYLASTPRNPSVSRTNSMTAPFQKSVLLICPVLLHQWWFRVFGFRVSTRLCTPRNKYWKDDLVFRSSEFDWYSRSRVWTMAAGPRCLSRKLRNTRSSFQYLLRGVHWRVKTRNPKTRNHYWCCSTGHINNTDFWNGALMLFVRETEGFRGVEAR